MTPEAEGVAWAFIWAWLGLGALVVLVLAVARYQREAAARREARRLLVEHERAYRRRQMERTREFLEHAKRLEQAREDQRWQRGRP